MKVLEPEVVPAPKRGQYDRGLSRRERQSAQRERVIAAIATLSTSGRELSVANVIELAGIGRNTFYEYFDDVEHALGAIRSRVVNELSVRVAAALELARTPLERIRALVRVWTEYAFETPNLLLKLALHPEPGATDRGQLSAVGRYVASVLDAQIDARSGLPGLADPLRVLVVAALFETVSRAQLADGSRTVQELQRVLSDLAIRVLR